jgi:hypothetical protein
MRVFMGSWEMTEDEAKTKWCPHARNGYAGSFEGDRRKMGEGMWMADIENGVVSVNTDAKCIASGCMSWRWKATTPETGQSVALDARGSAYYSPIFGRPEISDTDGYCGLAGSVT